MGKLWITTNHKPIITDDAMWRRLRPIPLTNIPEKIDPSLKPYLSDPDGGLPAVLSWAVEGAVKILNSPKLDPLGWCKAVQEAADVYKAAEDRIGIFLGESTRESANGSVMLKELYESYRYWSEERGERSMTFASFQRKLMDRGLKIEGNGNKAKLLGRARGAGGPDGGAAASSAEGAYQWARAKAT
jgi:phage/plasmid-associated DNA primase